MENICQRCSCFCVRPPSSQESSNIHDFSPERDSTKTMVKFLNQAPIDDCPHLRQQNSDHAIIPQH